MTPITASPKVTRFSVRQMLNSDIPKVKQIELAAGLSPWPEPDYHLELERKDSICLVCESESPGPKGAGIVGFLVSRFSSEEVQINNLAVAAEQRRRGAAESLLLRLKALCKGKPVSRIWLEVRQSNLAALGFYERMGFETAYRRKGFYRNPTEDAFVLKHDV